MTNEVRELFDFISTNGMSVLWDYGYGGSKAASVSVPEALPEVRVTELVNGVLVSKQVQKGPEIIDLQEYAKSKTASFSVQRNPVRELFDCIPYFN